MNGECSKLGRAGTTPYPKKIKQTFTLKACTRVFFCNRGIKEKAFIKSIYLQQQNNNIGLLTEEATFSVLKKGNIPMWFLPRGISSVCYKLEGAQLDTQQWWRPFRRGNSLQSRWSGVMIEHQLRDISPCVRSNPARRWLCSSGLRMLLGLEEHQLLLRSQMCFVVVVVLPKVIEFLGMCTVWIFFCSGWSTMHIVEDIQKVISGSLSPRFRCCR